MTLTATDFETVIFNPSNDAQNLVLITNPNPVKNMGIEKEFDRFSKRLTLKNHKLIASHYAGLNESERFKPPRKLPSILLFKRDEANVVQAIELERSKLLRSFTSSDAEIDKDRFDSILNEFISANSQ